MTPERAARLQAIADAHDAWEATWLPLTALDPEKAAGFGGDYNLHYLDVDPPAGAEEAFQALTAPPELT